MNTIAAVIVVLAGIWLIGLAAVAVTKPDVVRQFLDKFASSAFTHFLEMFVRIVVGAAFVVYSPQMKLPTIFLGFGCLLILTSAVLLFVPWKIHRRFADRHLPMVMNRMWLFAAASSIGGGMILSSFLLGTP